MRDKRFTAEQNAALSAEGEVIVSASAGSGKTSVMIEKIGEIITDGRASVGSLLAITFTRLAAAQMKEKLHDKLIKLINGGVDAQEKARLKTQLREVQNADITTIHAFCARLIRTYFSKAGVSADFDISDETQTNELRRRVIDLFFEDAFESADDNLLILLKCFARANKDKWVKQLIFDGYAKAVSKPNYFDFLSSVSDIYTQEGFEEVIAKLTEVKRFKLSALYDMLCEYYNEVSDEANALLLSKSFCDSLAASVSTVTAWRKLDYFALVNTVQTLRKPVKPRNLSSEGEAVNDKKEAIFDELNKFVKELKEECGDVERAKADFLNSGKTAVAFSRVLSEFADRYEQAKRKENLLDYNDLEQLAYRLLCDEQVACDVKNKYKYVFIDEYQDVNPVQEAIISKLSGGNIFMVGDVKQSIYGFRGCRSEFFANKFDRIRAEGGNALHLSSNFRSTAEIVDGVNAVFARSMTKKLCATEYADAPMRQGVVRSGGSFNSVFAAEVSGERPQQGGVYSVSDDYLNTLSLRDKPDGTAIAVAEIIAERLGKPYYDAQADEHRLIGYGDIAVLTRGNKAGARRIISELVSRGVPVNSVAKEDIFNYFEIKQLTEILKLIDNAEQDIPLAVALKSEIGGLDENELAKIRIAYSGGERRLAFYECVKTYRLQKKDDIAAKLNSFFDYYAKIKMFSEVKSCAELTAKLLADSDLENVYLAMPNGEARVRRVHRFIAEMRPNGKSLSLREFLYRLKNSDDGVGLLQSDGENAVKVMTIHASKGLEFPVVIAVDVNAPFNRSDDVQSLYYDDEYAFVSDSYDTERYVKRPTVLRTLVKHKLQLERVRGEMFLLYVALTRACQDLYAVFTKHTVYNKNKVAFANCFADFMDESAFSSFTSKAIEAPARRKKLDFAYERVNDELVEELKRRFDYVYAYDKSRFMPVKSSATKLREDGEVLSVPLFDEEEYTPWANGTSADVGTAYHRYLEMSDLSERDEAGVAAQLEKLRASTDEKLVSLLSVENVKKIVNMRAFKEVGGYELFREEEFLVSFTGDELYQTAGVEAFKGIEDTLLVQGKIDLLCKNGNSYIIYDYKYSGLSDEALKQKYAYQLRLYAQAVKKITDADSVQGKLINIRLCREISVEV